MGIQNKPADQAQGSSGLAQGKSFLLNKFSSLNQKVKQTKTNVNIGTFKPLGKLGTFSKPDVKVNFLKPTMHVTLWKSDSSLDNNPGAGALKDVGDEHFEMSSDSDSYNSDPEHPCSGSLENVDYVLPSCGIVASNSRLGSRSQSIGSVELNIPSVIRVTGCEGKQERPQTDPDDHASPGAASLAEEAILIDFDTPIDAYCHQFVQDAQTHPVEVFGEQPPPAPVPVQSRSSDDKVKQGNSEKEQQEEPQLPRPSQLDVDSSTSGSTLLSVQKPSSAASGGSQKSLGSLMEGSLGPSPADSNGSRVVSPFAKIKSSMVQVANLTQAGLTQGISFAVAKVQKSPEPDTVTETQERELKAMFTQCQTRIIQI